MNYFVLAATDNSHGNGHVAVIVPGPLTMGKYPMAYWGSKGGTPRRNTSLNYSFKAAMLDQIVYGYIPIPL